MLSEEAKHLAAADVARSEKTIALRQDQLRRETVQALQATPRLADALRRWPSPPPPVPPDDVSEEATTEAPQELQVQEELPVQEAPRPQERPQERAPKAAGCLAPY